MSSGLGDRLFSTFGVFDCQIRSNFEPDREAELELKRSWLVEGVTNSGAGMSWKSSGCGALVVVTVLLINENGERTNKQADRLTNRQTG